MHSSGMSNERGLTNPVFAIRSPGNPSVPATFTFDATPTFQSRGPNSCFGGSWRQPAANPRVARNVGQTAEAAVDPLTFVTIPPPELERPVHGLLSLP